VKHLAPLLFALALVACERFEPAEAAGNQPSAVAPEDPGPGTEEPLPPDPLPVPPPGEFAAVVDHPFFPLVPGTLLQYAGDEEGIPKRELVEVLAAIEVVGGVPCTTLVEQVFLAGELVETTTHWLAQDAQGNVWRFGERSLEYEDGVAVVTGDSWQAGVDGALPWMAFPRDPQPGDTFAGNGDEYEVLSVTATAQVPAGTFEGCLEIDESNPEDPEDRDRILYARGVGLVSEQSLAGSMRLVSHGVR
jgi:hypothetical protein